MSEQTLKAIADAKLIAVVRASSPEDVDESAKALVAGGIRAIEFSENTQQWARCLEQWAKRPDVVVGLGSVLDGEVAHRAITAGAQFVSSAYTHKDVITVCKNNDVVVVQGAVTPTEVMTAAQLGADIIRLFPSDAVGGPQYLHTLKEVLPSQIRFLPSSGVNLDNVTDYLKCPVVLAVVVGTALVDRSIIRTHNWQEITARARQFVEKVNSLKPPKKAEPAASETKV